jgi:hypothetical protein
MDIEDNIYYFENFNKFVDFILIEDISIYSYKLMFIRMSKIKDGMDYIDVLIRFFEIL